MGAKEWRENAAKMKAAFYPTHEAWGDYEPVGFDIIRTDISLPHKGEVQNAFISEYTAFVERESIRGLIS